MKDLPKSDWVEKKLGEVVTVTKTKGGGRLLPYVGLEDISSRGTGEFTGSLEPQGEKSTTFEFGPRHLLYGRLRPYLNKVYRPDFEGHCSSEIFPMLPNECLDRGYLFHWITSEEVVDKINATSTGARMPRANVREILQFPIPLPPLQEQRRIVAVLDEAFEGLDRARANAEANLQNARELFERQLESLFDAVHESSGSESLQQLIDIKHGFAFKSADFEASADKSLPIVLTPGDYSENATLVFRDGKTKRFLGKVDNNFRFDDGDLTVVMTDLSSKMKILGKPAFIEGDNILHNQRIGRVELLRGDISLRWIYYFLRTIRARRPILETATGTMVRHTAPKRILALQIPVPVERQEQEASINLLDQIENRTIEVQKRYSCTVKDIESLRQSLLQKAFAGELTSAVLKPSGICAANDNTVLSAKVTALAFSSHLSRGQERSFTHVKAQKLHHFAESICGIELGRQPVRDRAGPNDTAHMKRSDEWARQTNAFDFQKRKGKTRDYFAVKPLNNFDATVRKAKEALGDKLQSFERLLDIVVPLSWQDTEILATVHAAWNNLIIDGADVTDEAIVTAAREDWHPEKMNIDRQKFFDAIGTIRFKGIVPDGLAKYVPAKQERLL